MFGHSNDSNGSATPTGASDTAAPTAPGMAPADMSGFSLPSMQNEPTTPSPSPTDAPTGATPTPTVSPAVGLGADIPASSANPAAPLASDDLLDIKQQALQHLSPLLGHLEQTPEEKFRTTMMMIQAADDQTLIKPAYEAAQAITDEKTRAQALLDVVNEINYFTQQHNS